MDRFFVITNENRDPGQKLALQIEDYIRSNGRQCDHVCVERDSSPDSEEIMRIRDLPADTEAVIVLGGDGTFIQSAGILAAKAIPMIGVNLGHLGYLAEVDREKITPALDRLIRDEHSITDRMMISGTPVINGKERGCFGAVNDIVVRMPGSRVGNFCIEVNGTYLTTISGDGVIVATPTGSTAYNMSAGGPIVEPGSSMIVITPICPLKVVSRSVVLSADDVIVIRMEDSGHRRGIRAGVYFDGGGDLSLCPDDEVIIRKSEASIKLIKLNKESFLEVLSRKMGG